MAYRYFFAERVRGGENIVVGVGYLVSLVHHVAYALTDHVFQVPSSDLRGRINVFAFLTNGIVVGLMALTFVIAGQSRRLNWAQKILVYLAGLIPLFGTGFLGFDYAIMADYHHLNMVILAACVLMFERNWMSPANEVGARGIVANALLLGAFASNKVTVLPMAGIVLLPLLLADSSRLGRVLHRALLSGVALVVGFFLAHLAAYLGRFSGIVEMLPVWSHFVANPGGEPEFWEAVFPHHFWSYNSVYFCALFAVALVASLVRLAIVRDWNARRLVCIGGVLLGGALHAYAVIKRPAASTLFESGEWILALGFLLLGMLSTLRSGRTLTAAIAAGLVLMAAVTFPLEQCLALVRMSREHADVKFAFFRRALDLADGRPVTVILVDNSFHHEGFHELLLKGGSTFPSWHISKRGQSVIDRYAPGLTFRSRDEHDAPVNGPIPADSVLVLFHRPETAPLSQIYSEVGRFAALPTNRQEDWILPNKSEGQVVGTIIFPAGK